MNDLIIKISKASDEDGFFYDFYTVDDEDAESEDGGFCTSLDIRDAIEMASLQAQELVVLLDNKKQK